MRLKAIPSASVLLLVLHVGAVHSASITNRDERDHKVAIIEEGERAREQVLKPSSVLSDICPKGCIVRLNDDETDEYELEGPDVVSIEEGSLYYDGPEATSESAPDADRAQERKR